MPGEQERGRLQEVARVHGFFLQYPPGTVRNSALAEWVLSLTELGVSNVSSCTEQSRNNYSVLHRYIGDAAEAIQGECMCQSVMYTLYESEELAIHHHRYKELAIHHHRLLLLLGLLLLLHFYRVFFQIF